MTMRAGNIKALARQNLKGHWWLAVAVSFVASLFMNTISSNSSGSDVVNIKFSIASFSIGGIYIDGYGVNSFGLINNTAAMVFAIICALAIFFIDNAITLGRNTFYIKLCRGEDVRFTDLFSKLPYFMKALGLKLMMGLFTFLWMLLFIIPGIVAAYRYSMAPYIMANNPGIGILDAISESKRMMTGNKGKLFVLDLSFIGWLLLAALPGVIFSYVAVNLYMTIGTAASIISWIASMIGMLFLQPYMDAAKAEFYCRLAIWE